MFNIMSQSLGIFVLGVLAGWVAEWIFVRLFVPNPKKKVETALQASRKEIEALQKKNNELQSALTAAQAATNKSAPPAATEPAPAQEISKAVPDKEAAETKAKAAAPAPVKAKAEAAPATASSTALANEGHDDLTRLVGIGPKLAEAMNAAGINRYSQLAGLGVDELSERLASSNIRYSKAAAEGWATQAKLAAAGDWEGLKNHQASQKG